MSHAERQTQTLLHPDLPDFRGLVWWMPWDGWADVLLRWECSRNSSVCRCALEHLHNRGEASWVFWPPFCLSAGITLCSTERTWEVRTHRYIFPTTCRNMNICEFKIYFSSCAGGFIYWTLWQRLTMACIITIRRILGKRISLNFHTHYARNFTFNFLYFYHRSVDVVDIQAKHSWILPY